MAWIYLAASAGTLSLWKSGSIPLPTVSKTDMRRLFFCPECETGCFVRDLFGMTCALCEDETFPESTSLSEAFHARTSALQVAAQAWKASEVDFSSRSCAWPKKRSPHSYSLRTSPPYEREDLTPLSGHFPASGMTVDGTCYPLMMWARRTEENVGSLWPTLTASEGAKGGPGRRYGNGDKTLSATLGSPMNPVWLEPFMGFPIGWTELNALGIQWCPLKRGKHLKD